MDPCKTPDVTGSHSEHPPLQVTCCCLLIRWFFETFGSMCEEYCIAKVCCTWFIFMFCVKTSWTLPHWITLYILPKPLGSKDVPDYLHPLCTWIRVKEITTANIALIII